MKNTDDSLIKELNRPSWDEYFMEIAEIAKTRSSCIRRQVGAVLVNDKHQIISTGYNGVPRGIVHCTIETCTKLYEKSGEKNEVCPAVHAELNAIIQAATAGISSEGTTLYSTTRPCGNCTMAIINAGIRKVIYIEDYSDPILRSGWLDSSDVVFEKYEKSK
ncbi:MAG: dCMP deaminase family protein [Candidatus Heimdallarchaeota archaeon]|nr:dCMP deaminase family protein [Candidatus Heimdallarchaeota archaeon]MCG3257439.1 dCMP deaminase family protein [Candidatus Heimdallarchaeota archaeon]MCK4612492.1 dCMP deaminase family protein [Candidatus Heimdallarchaeota archaeon]